MTTITYPENFITPNHEWYRLIFISITMILMVHDGT